MSDGAEIASGALGHGAVATYPDIPYLEWKFEYEEPRSFVESLPRNNTENFLDACEKLHAVFRRFADADLTHRDESGGVEFKNARDKVRSLLSLQNGKAERSEEWRNAFKSGALGITPEEDIPVYSEETWHKQRDKFPGLAQPREVTQQEIYHFYQAASFHLHYVLRELFPKHGLMIV
jgi:hypothetical protein